MSRPSYSIAYLYTGDGRPYAAIYRAGETSVPFSLLTTDRGDVVGLLDSAGAPFASYRYDAWGRRLTSATQATGAIDAALAEKIASAQVLRYAGYAYDAESGLYYCSARHYDPATMQFLTKDIAKADAEESPYQYCGGDPVGKVDPSGMLAVSWTKATFPFWNFQDITEQLMRYMKANAAYVRAMRQERKWNRIANRLDLYTWWAGMVGNTMPWDFKQNLNPNFTWIFKGRQLRTDDIANIHYGFVGRAAGIGIYVLKKGAGVAQVKAGTSRRVWFGTNFDDPQDQRMIRYGFGLCGRTSAQLYGGSAYRR